MSTLRFRVVETAFTKKAVDVAVPDERPSEYFGKYVFNAYGSFSDGILEFVKKLHT